MSDKIEVTKELFDRMINALEDEGWFNLADEAAKAVAAPTVELSDEARDARRYRLLRSGEICIQDAGYGDVGGIYVWDQRGERHQECGNAIYDEELDAALDAELNP